MVDSMVRPMDLEIKADIAIITEILKKIGFEVKIEGNKVLEATLKERWGRFHVLGTQIDGGKVYLDVHHDALIHIAFLGVDYATKPKEICEKILDEVTKMRIEGNMIGGTSWFNRRNKAIFRGLRLKPLL